MFAGQIAGHWRFSDEDHLLTASSHHLRVFYNTKLRNEDNKTAYIISGLLLACLLNEQDSLHLHGNSEKDIYMNDHSQKISARRELSITYISSNIITRRRFFGYLKYYKYPFFCITGSTIF